MRGDGGDRARGEKWSHHAERVEWIQYVRGEWRQIRCRRPSRLSITSDIFWYMFCVLLEIKFNPSIFYQPYLFCWRQIRVVLFIGDCRWKLTLNVSRWALGVVEAVAEFSIDLPVDVVFIIHSSWLLLPRSRTHLAITNHPTFRVFLREIQRRRCGPAAKWSGHFRLQKRLKFVPMALHELAIKFFVHFLVRKGNV